MANIRKNAKEPTQDQLEGAPEGGVGRRVRAPGIFQRAARRVTERSKSSANSEQPVTTQRVERQASSAANQSPIDTSEVERVAYELFLKRGGEHGYDREDWLKAEEIIRQRSRRR